MSGAKLTTASIIIALVSSMIMPVYAAQQGQQSPPQLQKLLQKIATHEQQLQRQVASLQHQVAQLKSQLKQTKTVPGPPHYSHHIPQIHHAQGPQALQVQTSPRPYPSTLPVQKVSYAVPAAIARPVHVPEKTFRVLNQAGNRQELPQAMFNPRPFPQTPFYSKFIAEPRFLDYESLHNQATLTALYLGGISVFTSPYLGINSAYDGSNLVVNASSVNLDVRLLRQQRALQQNLLQHGIALPRYPVIVLSGKLEGQVFYNTTSGGGSSTGDINLSTARLDIFARMNPYVLGFISLNYDDSATNPIRVSNSRFDLRQGFITLGRLAYSPLYLTVGQIFVPFGQYSSYMLSSPLTQILARTRQRAITIGYHPDHGLILAAYGFRGDTRTNRRAQGGANIGYNFNTTKVQATVVAGWISNIAESEGMQASGAPGSIPFNGFSFSRTTETLQHAVQGFDVNGHVGIGAFTLIGEYVTALRAFSPLDLSFNGKGARPQAAHIEAAYVFPLHGKPVSVAFSYGWTREALFLLLPRQRFMAVFNISVWRDTIASIEYRHDINYKASDRASGAGRAPFGRLNRTADQVTLQLGIYF